MVCVPTEFLILKVAVCAPLAVGLNVTVMVQFQPGLRLDPHVDFSLTSPASVPPTVSGVLGRGFLFQLHEEQNEDRPHADCHGKQS